MEACSYIYVLRLEGGKFYVGKTNNLQSRICDHFAGKGAAWTTVHKVVSVYSTCVMKSPLDEHATTLEMMHLKGIENVRGAEFASPVLTPDQKEAIRHALAVRNDVCFKCGQAGHFARHCPKGKKKVATRPLKTFVFAGRAASALADAASRTDTTLRLPTHHAPSVPSVHTRSFPELWWQLCLRKKDDLLRNLTQTNVDYMVGKCIAERAVKFPNILHGETPLCCVYFHFDIGFNKREHGYYFRTATFVLVTERLNLLQWRSHFPHDGIPVTKRVTCFDLEHPDQASIAKAKRFVSQSTHHSKVAAEFMEFGYSKK